MKKKRKKIEKICQNCRLFNERDNVCSVTVIIAGEHYELPVLPNDTCHWERINREIDLDLEKEIGNVKKMPLQERAFFQPKLESERDHAIEIKQIRAWSDGKDGHLEY